MAEAELDHPLLTHATPDADALSPAATTSSSSKDSSYRLSILSSRLQCMDRRGQPERKATKRGREEGEEAAATVAWGVVEFPFDDDAAAAADVVGDEATWRRAPPGVFRSS
uniref:Uncharacterized protein n=1 Tax=Oryza punctata TaxID=4537 RepID=A0A0E0M2J9_ORYPU